MNTYEQSVISANDFGGEIIDYYPLHYFMDSLSSFYPHVKSALWFHNHAGAYFIAKKYLETPFINGVHVSSIAIRHIMNEFGFIPQISDVIDLLPDSWAKPFDFGKALDVLSEKYTMDDNTYETFYRFICPLYSDENISADFTEEKKLKSLLFYANSFMIRFIPSIIGIQSSLDKNKTYFMQEVAKDFICAGYGYVPNLYDLYQEIDDKAAEKFLCVQGAINDKRK